MEKDRAFVCVYWRMAYELSIVSFDFELFWINLNKFISSDLFNEFVYFFTGSWRWMEKTLQLSLSTGGLYKKSSRYEGTKLFEIFNRFFLFFPFDVKKNRMTIWYSQVKTGIWKIEIFLENQQNENQNVYISMLIWLTAIHNRKTHLPNVIKSLWSDRIWIDLYVLLSNLFSIDIFRWHEPFGCTTCVKLPNCWTPFSLYWERNNVKLHSCIFIIIHWCQSAV